MEVLVMERFPTSLLMVLWISDIHRHQTPPIRLRVVRIQSILFGPLCPLIGLTTKGHDYPGE
jgi:hypothetical protein